MKRALIICVFSMIAVLALNLAATADVLSTYGDTAVVPTPGSPAPPPQPNSWQFTSDTQGTGYAGLELQITGNLTPAVLTNLSANYLMTQGSFGGGAPRFTLFDSSFNSAWIYWGTPQAGGNFSDPSGGTAWGSTGNFADLLSNDLRVYSNCFGGYCNPNVGLTWAQFVNQVGNTAMSYITLDMDGGFTGTQQMLVSSMTVNDRTYEAPTPEPGTLMMLGTGALGVAGVVRRKLHA
jgi:hypothetical protein